MRVVLAVRAGEAKLRGRMTIVVLFGGPPGESIRVFSSGFSLRFVVIYNGFKDFRFAMVLKHS